MLGQQFTGFLHAVDDARSEFRTPKITGHGRRQFPPKGIATLGMHGGIANDGKFVSARGHENEDGIALGELLQAQS